MESPFRKSVMLNKTFIKAQARKSIINPASTANYRQRCMSFSVVSNSSEKGSNAFFESLQPATALNDIRISHVGRAIPESDESSSSFRPVSPNKSCQSKSLTEEDEDDDDESSTLLSSPMIRLPRSLSVMQKRVDVPTRHVTIRTGDGGLTDDFKQLLVDLAKKRLKEEIASYSSASDDSSLVLMRGAFDYLNKVKKEDFKVDGTTSMIPEEYRLSAEKADQGRTEADILMFEIERMRGSSMKIGTEQTTRKVPKGTTVTSQEENLVRKLIEIGFLLNDRSVTSTISRFIESENSLRVFKSLGLRQRSKECGRVMLNKLFSQEYREKKGSLSPLAENDDSVSGVSSIKSR